MGSKSQPTYVQSLLAGGVAGTTVDLLFFPIDTIKTRLQSSQGFSKAGAFKNIYKGVGSVIIGSAPGAAVFFSTYDTLKRVLSSSTNSFPVNHMLSASIAEVVCRNTFLYILPLTHHVDGDLKAACLIRVPTEVIKSRTQTSTYGVSVSSSLNSASNIMSQEGLRGFYRGFGSTVMREIPFTSIQFPLYEFLKLQLARRLHRDKLGAHEAAFCGSIAGGFAAAATTPLDVLKTRTMLDLREFSKEQVPNLVTRFIQIYRLEGIRTLFSGILPRTLWISAGGAVFLGAYEWTVHTLMGS